MSITYFNLINLFYLLDAALPHFLTPVYANFLEEGVIFQTGSERSGVTLTIIKKPWEHQHISGRWYSEIKHKNDSCWRIPEKNEFKKVEVRNDKSLIV
jgi:hypothetical protein